MLYIWHLVLRIPFWTDETRIVSELRVKREGLALSGKIPPKSYVDTEQTVIRSRAGSNKL